MRWVYEFQLNGIILEFFSFARISKLEFSFDKWANK
jgi:hypothetical protein